MKLSTKSSLLIVAIVAVLFIPLSSTMVHFQEAALRRAAYNTVDSAAMSSSLAVSQVLENAQREAHALAATFPIEALRARRLAVVQTYLRQAYNVHDFTNGMFVLDAQGNFLLDYPAHLDHQGRSLAAQPYVQRTMAERRGVLSEPYLSGRTGRPVLTITAPIFDERGAILGVLACSFDLLAPDAFKEIYTHRLGQTGYVYVFDRSRLMILHPDFRRILQRDIPAGSNLVLDKAIEGFEGTGSTVNSRGVPMLLSYRKIPGTNWILGAQIPQAEAFEAISGSRRVMLVTTVISLLVILVISVLMVGYLARPLGLLHRAARAITLELEAGKPGEDLIPMLQSITSGDEIQHLAQTFIELVERQRSSLGMLKQAASEWERTFDAVDEALLCLDPEGKIQRINRMAGHWFRINPELAVGLGGKALVLGEDATAAFWPEADLLDAEHAQAWMSPLPHREGLFGFKASPVLHDGAVSGMILSIRACPEPAQKEEDIDKRAVPENLQRIPCVGPQATRLTKLIEAAEVEFVYSSESGVHVVTAKGEYLTELTLAVLETRTPRLVRCHKQYLVNLRQVHELQRPDLATVFLRTRSGKEVPVGRRFLPRVKELLGL